LKRRFPFAAKLHSVAVRACGALLILTPLLSRAQTPPAAPRGYGYGPGMMWGGGWYGLIFGPLFMILSLVVVIGAVALVARWFGASWHGTQSPHVPPPRTALDILKERYARGEIDKEEFEERRRVLGE
jgi:putative membrane protein